MFSLMLWRVSKNSRCVPYIEQFPYRVYIDKDPLIYLDSLILLYYNELNTTYNSRGSWGRGGRRRLSSHTKQLNHSLKVYLPLYLVGRAPVTSCCLPSDVFPLSMECLLPDTDLLLKCEGTNSDLSSCLCTGEMHK